MKKIEFFELNNQGKTIRGVHHHHHPPKFSNKKVVIFLNGYRSSWGDGSREQKIHSDYLSSKGYEIIRFDYIGYGESDGDFSMANISSMINDTNLVIEYALKLFPEYEIILSGASMGGLIALATANQNRFTEVKKIILSCPAIDFYHIYMSDKFKQGISTPMVDIEDKEYVKYWEEDLKKYENQLQEFTFKGKSFIIHGSNDPVVPVEDVVKFAKNFNIPYHIVEGGDHGFKLPGTGPEAIRRNLKQRHELGKIFDDFLEKN